MIQTEIIEYLGIKLEVCSILVETWPQGFPLAKWPTFCGAGNGLGDRIVPDKINGTNISCCCYDHDVSWAIADGSFRDFLMSNARFYLNLRSVVMPVQKKNWFTRYTAERKCFAYFIAVCRVGWSIYQKDHDGKEWNPNPLSDLTVRDRMHRLAMATMEV